MEVRRMATPEPDDDRTWAEAEVERLTVRFCADLDAGWRLWPFGTVLACIRAATLWALEYVARHPAQRRPVADEFRAAAELVESDGATTH